MANSFKNLLVNGKNNITANRLANIQNNLQNTNTASNMQTVTTPNLPTVTRPATVNLQKAQQPVQTKLNNINSQTATPSIVSNNPAFQNGQLVNNQTSRFIGFQNNQPKTDLAGNITPEGVRSLQGTGKSWGVEQNKPILNIPTKANEIKAENEKYDKEYKEREKLIKQLHWDIKNANGQLTKEDIKKKYKQWKGKENEVLELQKELRPLIQQGQYGNMQDIQQYYSDLFAPKEKADETALKEQEEESKKLSDMKARADKLLNGNNSLSQYGTKYLQDVAEITGYIDYIKNNYRLLNNPSDSDILAWGKENIPELKELVNDMQQLESYGGMTDRDWNIINKNGFNLGEWFGDATKAVEGVVQKWNDTIESGTAGRWLNENLNINRGTADTLLGISQIPGNMAASLMSGIDRTTESVGRLSSGQSAADNSTAKDLIKTGGGVLETAFNTVWALPTAIFHLANQTPMGEAVTNATFGKLEEKLDDWQSGKSNNSNNLYNQWYNSLDEQEKSDLLNEEIVAIMKILHIGGKGVKKIGDFEINAAKNAINDVIKQKYSIESNSSTFKTKVEQGLADGTMKVSDDGMLTDRDGNNIGKVKVRKITTGEKVKYVVDKVLSANRAAWNARSLGELNPNALPDNRSIKEKAQYQINQAKENINEGIETAKQGVNNAVDTAKQGVNTVVQGAKNIKPGEIVKGTSETVGKGVKAASDLLESGKNAITRGKNAVTNAVNENVVEPFKKGVNAVKESVNENILDPYNKGRGKTNEISTEGINQGLQPQESTLASESNTEINGGNYNQNNTNSKTLNKAQLQILQTNNRMNPKNIDNFKERYGEDYGQWMYDRGFTKSAEGGNLQDMQEYKDSLLASKRATLNEIEGRYQDISLTDMADHLIEKAENVKNRKLLKEVQDIKNTLDSIGLTMKEANRLRELFQQNIKMGFHQDIPADVRERAKNEYLAVKDFLDEIGRQNGFDDLDEINREIQKAQHIIKGVESKMNRQSANNEYTLTDYILMAEAFSNPQTAAVFTAKQILKHPKVRNAVLNTVVGGRENSGNRITPESRKGTNEKVENVAKVKRGEKLKADLSKGDIKGLPDKGGTDNGKHIITGGRTIVTDAQGNSKVKGQISEIDKRPNKSDNTTPSEDTTLPSKPTTPTKPTEPKNKITNKTPKKKSESKPKAESKPQRITAPKKERQIIKNDKGENEIVYHGTNAKFDKFDKNFIGRGGGFRFTTSKGEAESYGKNVKEYNLMASNIMDFDSPEFDDLATQIIKQYTREKFGEEFYISPEAFIQDEGLRNYAQELGYDALKFSKGGDVKYIVYNEDQIIPLQNQNQLAPKNNITSKKTKATTPKAESKPVETKKVDNSSITGRFRNLTREEYQTMKDFEGLEDMYLKGDKDTIHTILDLKEAMGYIDPVKYGLPEDIEFDFHNWGVRENARDVAEIQQLFEELRDGGDGKKFEKDWGDYMVEKNGKMEWDIKALEEMQKDMVYEMLRETLGDEYGAWSLSDYTEDLMEQFGFEREPRQKQGYLFGELEKKIDKRMDQIGTLINKYGRYWEQGQIVSPETKRIRSWEDFRKNIEENETPQIAEEDTRVRDRINELENNETAQDIDYQELAEQENITPQDIKAMEEQLDYLDNLLENETPQITEEETPKNKITSKTPEKPKNLVTNSEFQTLPEDVSVWKEQKKNGPKRIAPDRISWQQLTYEDGAKRMMEDIKKIARHIELQREFKKPSASRTDTRPLSEINSELLQTGREVGSILGKNWLYKSTRSQEFKDLWRAIANANNDPSTLASIGKEFYEKKVKQDLSKGYVYPDDVIDKIPGAKKAADARQRYQKGLDTSFSSKDERIDYSAKDKIGGGMKRQDGKPLTEEQKNEIVKGVVDFQKTFAINMKKMAEDLGIVYVHVNGKKVFMSKASGMFKREYNDDGTLKNASISVGGVETVRWKDEETGEWKTESANTIMSHELGHVVDYVVDRNLIVGRDITDLWTSYKRPENNHSGYAAYLRRDAEVVARAFEEYLDVAKGGDHYYDKVGYWSKDKFEKLVKPILERNIKEKLGDWYINPDDVKYQKVLSNSKNKVTNGVKKADSKLKNQIKKDMDQLMKTGLVKGYQFVQSTKDLFNLINGTTTQPRYQAVWHGSPYEFTKFDSANMGKGEGDQAHGWGHYVAVNKKTGEHYADLRGPRIEYKGKLLDIDLDNIDGLSEEYIANLIGNRIISGKTFEEAKKSLIDMWAERLIRFDKLNKDHDLTENYYQKEVDRTKAKIKMLKSIKEEDFGEIGGRNLYQVEIPDQKKADTPTGSNYWEENDKALSTDEINGIMNELLKKKTKGAERVKNAIDYDLKDGDKISGKTMLFNLRAGLGDKKASQFLESLGYDGIHYIGAVDGEAYVIFNDNALEITNHIQYLKDNQGNIAGATLPDGTVIFVEDSLRADTAFHETSHRLVSYAQENSPELYNSIVKIAEEAPQELKDYVKNTYGDLSPEAFVDEVFAWRQGKYSSVKAQTWYNRMWEAIKRLWNNIKSKFGKEYADLSVFEGWEKMNSEQLMKEVDNLLKGGKEVGNANGSLRYEQAGTNSPEFKKWFDGSKVVDENGEPLEVYHGTDKLATHNKFTRSVNWFTDSETYAGEAGVTKSLDNLKKKPYLESKYYEDSVLNPKIYKTYLNISNPLVVDGHFALWDSIKTPTEMGGKGTKTTDQIANWAKKNGYDGVIINNVEENGKNTNQYAVFEPTQIKSATDNVGTYDKNNPDIRYQKNVLSNGKNNVTNGVRFQRTEGDISDLSPELRNKVGLNYQIRDGNDEVIHGLLDYVLKKKGITGYKQNIGNKFFRMNENLPKDKNGDITTNLSEIDQLGYDVKDMIINWQVHKNRKYIMDKGSGKKTHAEIELSGKSIQPHMGEPLYNKLKAEGFIVSPNRIRHLWSMGIKKKPR